MPVVWMKSSSMIKIYATSCFPADHINPVSTHSQRRGVDVYLSFQVPFYLTYCWKNRSPLMYLSKSKLLKNRKKKKREETCYICKTKYQQNKSIKKKYTVFCSSLLFSIFPILAVRSSAFQSNICGLIMSICCMYFSRLSRLLLSGCFPAT